MAFDCNTTSEAVVQ